MAYLEITLSIVNENRPSAAAVYNKYKASFLKDIKGAKSKELLVRDEDVQVLHCFDSAENAAAYLKTELFNNDVVRELGPLLQKDPEMRIYNAV